MIGVFCLNFKSLEGCYIRDWVNSDRWNIHTRIRSVATDQREAVISVAFRR
ncbi:hypothetical protein DAI22_07g142350 [Oryza sativa Japonica Group]|nr:hypothetical protein DAI22_07g142350 [Oryza sativa Japonica Group]